MLSVEPQQESRRSGTISDCFSLNAFMHTRPRLTWFLICATATIAIIYSLILVGGIVRATGSGMGCPDWPTCFGQWVPPTSEAQLPSDYQQIYADRGYADTTFNVRKTWTEYLNRLLGVLTGLAILLTLLFAVPLRRREPQVFMLALAGFILVGVQGWLGSRVVASNLNPAMITVHMILAQVIVGLLIGARLHVQRRRYATIRLDALPRAFYPVLLVMMVAGLTQLILGTQVREGVDLIARQSDYENRHLWIDNLPLVFELHKYFAIPLIVGNLWLIVQMFTHTRSRSLYFLNAALIGLLVGTSAIGMSMDRLNLPMVAQPLHLWLASLIFGTQLAILLVVHYARAGRAQGAVEDAAGPSTDASRERSGSRSAPPLAG